MALAAARDGVAVAWVEPRAGGYRVRWRNQAGRLCAWPHLLPTRTAARQVKAMIEADQARGTFVDPAGGKTTVGEFAAEWFRARRVRRTTAAKEDSLWRNHLEPAWGAVPLGDLVGGRLRLQRFFNVLADPVVEGGRQLSRDTVASCFRLLRLVLDAAVEEELIPRHPCKAGKIALAGADARAPVALDPAQARTLLEHLPAGLAQAVVVTPLATGFRWGEVAGLAVGDVDLQVPQASVVEPLHELAGERWRERPKSRASKRTVPLPALEAVTLDAFVDRDSDPAALVFVGQRGASLSRGRFRKKYLLPALKDCGLWPGRWPRDTRGGELAPVTFQDLRHSYASWLADAGVPVPAIAELLGHALGAVPTLHLEHGVTGRYLHTVPGVLDRVVAALDERLPERLPASRRVLRPGRRTDLERHRVTAD